MASWTLCGVDCDDVKIGMGVDTDEIVVVQRGGGFRIDSRRGITFQANKQQGDQATKMI